MYDLFYWFHILFVCFFAQNMVSFAENMYLFKKKQEYFAVVCYSFKC